VRLLLDTNAVLWAISRSRLSPATLAAVEDPGNEVFVSAVSPWEIEIKRAKGRLKAPEDVIGAIGRAGFSHLAMTAEHGVAAGRLPPHHRDPFDRMLVAQAQFEGLTIVTGDAKIARYQVAVLPA
jgi:PIN domain nuclease of toxin-antitoxin system